jgi:hypothetical protein
LSGTCGFIAELVEVYEGLGYLEDKEGMVSRGGVRVRHGGGMRSPISARRALWSLNFVGIAVVTVGGGCCASVGMRINQWSKGVLVGVYVGVRGSPKCLSCVSLMRFAMGL